MTIRQACLIAAGIIGMAAMFGFVAIKAATGVCA